MTTSDLLLWMMLFTGSIVAAWWLTVRPGASLRGAAAPASALVIVMAVLLCLMALTGQEPEDLVASARSLWRGY
jgi:hypothetical protein